MIRKLIVILLTGTLCLIGITPVLAKGYATLAEYEKLTGNRIEKFNEAPTLKTKVAAGILPPVEERLPRREDIYVVEPNEKIGIYGGTARTVGIAPEGDADDEMLLSSPMFVTVNPEGTKFLPHLAKKIESSKDKTTWTIYLRKGLKWSDGHPYTADDVMFWYNDILLNKELTPVIGPAWKVKGKVMEMKKIDDYTVQVKFSAPKPLFLNRLFMETNYWAMVAPKHYLKQFHPNYTSSESLKKKISQSGFDHWYELFGNKYKFQYGLPLNPDLPTVTAYKCVELTGNRRVFERNPYFWKVDSEGNQLPYIDRIFNQTVSNKEAVQGKIISGEVDFAGFNNDIRNYPMYKQSEKKVGQRVILWRAGYKSETVYMVNLTHRDPVLRKIFQDVRFRRALSLAIDRERINDTIYFGKGKPVQYTVLDVSKFYDPKFETYIKYDPERAKKLLDEMGLKDTNGDGWRDRPDGKRLTFTIEYYPAETPKAPNVEIVVENWRNIGIDVRSKQISGTLAAQRAPANLLDACVWHGDTATDVMFPIDPYFVVPTPPGWERTIWPAWGRWFNTGGKAGEEPPAQIKQIYGWWQAMKAEPNEEERIKLGKKILAAQAENLWTIGTVGKTPWPLIINNRLHNFPKNGLWVWDTLWTISQNPEQLFFDKAKR